MLWTYNSVLFQLGLQTKPRSSQLVQMLNAPTLLAGARVCKQPTDAVFQAVIPLRAQYVGRLFCERKCSEDSMLSGPQGVRGADLSWWAMWEEVVETATDPESQLGVVEALSSHLTPRLIQRPAA